MLISGIRVNGGIAGIDRCACIDGDDNTKRLQCPCGQWFQDEWGRLGLHDFGRQHVLVRPGGLATLVGLADWADVVPVGGGGAGCWWLCWVVDDGR